MVAIGIELRGVSMSEPWPELPYGAWKGTYATLHLWTQIVGKAQLALSPWLNHSWHVTFRVTARGLATPLAHFGTLGVEFEFDFVDHALLSRTTDGRTATLALAPMTVAAFHACVLEMLSKHRIDVHIDGMPNEIPDAVPFPEDFVHCAYDAEYARRFWRILVSCHDVFSFFRTSFLGKTSPVHFFWGGFDLAVTRFSGRRAPLHPGGIPHLSDAVTRESYSHEVSSAGFWPGGQGIDCPAFYSYAYPAPAGFASA